MMQVHIFRVTLLSSLFLGACGYPLNGTWEGIERQIITEGEVSEQKSLPYEECYPSIDPETQEVLEGTSNCIDRGFSIMIDAGDISIFEATNDLNVGQKVALYMVSRSGATYILSDGERFEISCFLDGETKDKLLYCDFTNTIGYLSDSRIVFEQSQD